MFNESPAYAGDFISGMNKVGEVVINQYHIDDQVNNYIKKVIPAEYLSIITKYGGVIKIINDKRVEVNYKWNF